MTKHEEQSADHGPTLSTKHDFSESERCRFCDVNQWEISTGEDDCTPHPFIHFTTETPAPSETERDSLARLVISPILTDDQWDRWRAKDNWAGADRLRAAYAAADAILAAGYTRTATTEFPSRRAVTRDCGYPGSEY